jgi:hypothetical protein
MAARGVGYATRKYVPSLCWLLDDCLVVSMLGGSFSPALLEMERRQILPAWRSERLVHGITVVWEVSPPDIS